MQIELRQKVKTKQSLSQGVKGHTFTLTQVLEYIYIHKDLFIHNVFLNI